MAAIRLYFPKFTVFNHTLVKKITEHFFSIVPLTQFSLSSFKALPLSKFGSAAAPFKNAPI